MAQSPKALVVVTHTLDEDFVKRIGDEFVEVEVLFAAEADLETVSYEACNNRVHDLQEFRILFFRGDKECPIERFWRDRMSARNPKGEVRCLPQSRYRVEIECRIQRAKEIHAALTLLLPDHHEQLNANLQLELQRLCKPRIFRLQLALHE
ncbi:MAG: hypothetical protein P8N76_17385 [Pirellulaceae bacterium]|nr:hypothetical protein [Pirellulaceae bacterium]